MPKSQRNSIENDRTSTRPNYSKQPEKALFPQMLADKMDHLSAKVHQLTDQLAKKDARINELEKKVAALDIQADDTEQYSRCSILRF